MKIVLGRLKYENEKTKPQKVATATKIAKRLGNHPVRAGENTPRTQRARKMKTTTSIQKDRRALLERMSRGRRVVTKTIPFRNNDVPKFLKRLDRFEKASRRSRLIAK